MSEEAKLQESVKKTQDLLGKHIKKPPLTEKLLKKPPFRFLHDIVSSVVKDTGFLKGLFNEFESNSLNIKDKDTKISYLTKLIDVVKLITGNELAVKPSKIVSGQEPIKTNELLQAIGKALDKKISSSEAIEHYKKSSEKKKNTTVKLRKSSSPQEKPKASGSGEEKVRKPISSDDKGKKLTSRRTPSSERVSSKEKIKSRNEKIKKESSNERKEVKSTDSKRKDSSGTIKKSRKSHDSVGSEEKVRKKKIIPVSDEQENIENILIPTEEIQKHQEPIEKIEKKNSQDEKKKDDENELQLEKKDEILIKVLEPLSDLNILTEKNVESQIILESKMPVVVPTTTTTTGTLRPPSVRPSSARPGAPRVRGKSDFVINTNAITPIGDVSVIVENFDGKDDDQDGLVVMETMDNSEIIQGNSELLNNQLTQEHGYLVAQILETQRELVNEGNVDIIPNKVEIEWEAGLRKDRDTVVKEVDKLRGAIQTLTRTTNPLGKLLDYLQEDVDTMKKELWKWRNEYSTIKDQLKIEKNSINESMKPLEISLKEIEAAVKIQMDSICQTKSNIIRNQQKIHKLLTGE